MSEKLERDINALKDCIEYWDDIEEFDDILGIQGCALCLIYWGEIGKAINLDMCCIGCPISANTGQKVCNGTPYEELMNLEERDEEGIICDSEVILAEFEELLTKQRAYLATLLVSLRTEEKKEGGYQL